jgi:hypothetical protein
MVRASPLCKLAIFSNKNQSLSKLCHEFRALVPHLNCNNHKERKETLSTQARHNGKINKIQRACFLTLSALLAPSQQEKIYEAC